MNSIVRAFWWGHAHGVKKLHSLNWNKICYPKSWEGLGLKRFNLMNQAMLAKQYWRIRLCLALCKLNFECKMNTREGEFL